MRDADRAFHAFDLSCCYQLNVLAFEESGGRKGRPEQVKTWIRTAARVPEWSAKVAPVLAEFAWTVATEAEEHAYNKLPREERCATTRDADA